MTKFWGDNAPAPNSGGDLSPRDVRPCY